MSEKEQDLQMVDSLSILFEQFWVLRHEEPQAYRLIREKEQKIRRYVSEKFGYDLVVHPYFIKLEKLPVEPQPWMGIQDFQTPLDYVMFCSAMAFTEQKAIDEQFLLSDVAEAIQDLYPGELPLDFTNYQHRKSLVRVLKKMVELSLIKTIDGNVELFQSDAGEEVLYEVSVHARYFMKSYPEALVNFDSLEELIESEWRRAPDDRRRKRVYRKLMLSPVVHRMSSEDEDFAYIRNFRNRLSEDLEKHTPFQLDVFQNTAMLTLSERKRRYTLFPLSNGLSEIALQVMAKIRESGVEKNEFGRVRMPRTAFIELVRRVKEETGSGWGQANRVMSVNEVAGSVIDLWYDWELAQVDGEMDAIILLPGAGRIIGHYPSDFRENGVKIDGE